MLTNRNVGHDLIGVVLPVDIFSEPGNCDNHDSSGSASQTLSIAGHVLDDAKFPQRILKPSMPVLPAWMPVHESSRYLMLLSGF